MKFKLPFSTEKKTGHFLALDIGTEAIKALVFQRVNGENVVLGNSLEYFDRFGVFDGVSFETDVIKDAILKAVSEARSQAQVKTNSLFLGLPANIFQSKTFLQRLQRKDKSKINIREEEEIYQEIKNNTEKEITELAQRSFGLLSQDIQIDLKILDTKIDGYNVDRISGFSGQNLEFRILASVLPKHYLQNIRDIFADLNLKLVKISNLAESLPNLLSGKKEQAIFIDVGGELTQLFLVRESITCRISEFELGGRFFSRTLSNRFGLTEKVAREMKENYAKKHFSEESMNRVREVLSPSVQKWFFSLKLKLKEEKLLLPSKIYLFGGGSLLPEIPEVLKKGSWTDLPFVSKPEIKVIFPKDLPGIEDKTFSLTSSQQVPPLLICFS